MSHQPDRITSLHTLPAICKLRIEMCIIKRVILRYWRKKNNLAPERIFSDLRYHTIGSSNEWCAMCSKNVNTFMFAHALISAVAPVAFYVWLRFKRHRKSE